MNKAKTKSSAWTSLTELQKEVIKEIVNEQVREFKHMARCKTRFTGKPLRPVLWDGFEKIEVKLDLKETYQRIHAEIKRERAWQRTHADLKSK